jgi:hypothetical protein
LPNAEIVRLLSAQYGADVAADAGAVGKTSLVA